MTAMEAVRHRYIDVNPIPIFVHGFQTHTGGPLLALKEIRVTRFSPKWRFLSKKDRAILQFRPQPTTPPVHYGSPLLSFEGRPLGVPHGLGIEDGTAQRPAGNRTTSIQARQLAVARFRFRLSFQ